jgi:hypothetical protein
VTKLNYAKTLPLGFLLAASIGTSGAQAADPCGMHYMISELTVDTFSCYVGDKMFSNFDFSWTDGTFAFSNSPADRFTFSGTGISLAPGTHTYSYDVSIFGSPDTFLEYSTDIMSSSDPLPTSMLTMSVLSNTTNTNKSEAKFPNAGNQVGLSGTSTRFLGEIKVDGDPSSRIDGFTDSIWQTPGPLPVLGAGVTFGFSRKLRKRIKASL